MKIMKNEKIAVFLALLLSISMAASILLIPNANASSTSNIPTYAYISAAPNPIGVGQTLIIYMWLDAVYGAAGGSFATVGTNGYTASAALLANDYRFLNYELFITSPNGTTSEVTFPIISDTTSSQYYDFTPNTVGTYTFNFTYPGQVYGANGNGYALSPIFGDTYLPSSATTSLTVQSSPAPTLITTTPLPTSYWQEPIYAENSNWYVVSSNWLGMISPVPGGYTSSSLYHGDAVGPDTSHVMWTSPQQNGGTVGGNMFTSAQGTDYFEGSSYSPRFYNPIIMNGYLYYTETAGFDGASSFGSSTTGPTVCVNLRTGQVLWSNPNIPALSFGYIQNLNDPDQHGTFPTILVAMVDGQWDLYDGYTGDSLFNVTGVPQAASMFGVSMANVAAGPSGEQLIYNFANAGTAANPDWYLSEWNSSKIWQYDINPYSGFGSLSPSIVNASNGVLVSQLPIPVTGESGTAPSGMPVSVPYGSTLTVDGNIPINSNEPAPGTTMPIKEINEDSLTTYDWNISVPWVNTLSAAPSILAIDYGDMMLCLEGSLPSGFATTGAGYPQLPYTMIGVNLNASVGAVGKVLWTKTYDPPSGNVTLEMGAVDWQTRTWSMSIEETIQWEGFSLVNGDQLWGPIAPETAFDYYGTPGVSILVANEAYGTLYSSSFGGICYAYNDQTGQVEWTWGNGAPGSDNSTYAGFTTPYGVYPTFVQSIANGIVYLATDEHTITNPIYKGAEVTALNATTGEQIWQLSGYPSEWSSSGTSFVVADGYLTFFNGYNSEIYSIGKGPSATTVTAPDVGVTTATPITITGTVMDISAGTKQSEQAADFPNGVPVSSDASMGAWMEYVYDQQPEPTNFTGVPVTLSVLDSNGNHRPIGTVMTDESGTYSLTWTPDISGNFTVYATFAGTNGYYPSSAETHIYASVPQSTPAPTASPIAGLASNNTLVYGIVAIIVVIVIIGAVIMLMLNRKRPLTAP